MAVRREIVEYFLQEVTYLCWSMLSQDWYSKYLHQLETCRVQGFHGCNGYSLLLTVQLSWNLL